MTNGLVVLKELLNGILYYRRTWRAAENAQSNRAPVESTANPKRSANILWQSELGENKKMKAHLKETLLPEFQSRRQREHYTPRHQKSPCLKLRGTRMVEHQTKRWGNEGGLDKPTLFIKSKEPLRKSTAKFIIGSSPNIAEQKCLPFGKRSVVESSPN